MVVSIAASKVLEMPTVKSLLDIFVISFNRSAKLGKTINAIMQSALRRYSVTVLDNCSTDGTEAVMHDLCHQYPELKYLRRKVNIGGPANAIDAFTRSEAKYTWVICDDDEYDFADVNELFSLLESESPELIFVGGHAREARFDFQGIEKVRTLCERGFNFFRDGSFLPGVIYKTALAHSDIDRLHKFAYWMYPHLAMLFDVYDKNGLVAVTRQQLITAVTQGQRYDVYEMLGWWIGLAKGIRGYADARTFLGSQWRMPFDQSGLYGAIATAIKARSVSAMLYVTYLYNVRVFTLPWLYVLSRVHRKNARK
jgi:glycosyltransferase involved in cell wall biosynthesis